jgi:hypothetical protein
MTSMIAFRFSRLVPVRLYDTSAFGYRRGVHRPSDHGIVTTGEHSPRHVNTSRVLGQWIVRQAPGANLY